MGDHAKAIGGRDGPAMAIDDVASHETDPCSSDNDSPSTDISSKDVTSPPASSPSATASKEDVKHSASSSTEQLPETELKSGQDSKESISSNLKKKNMDLDLRSQVPSTLKLPLISLGDDSCPVMVQEGPLTSMLPLNIPSVAVDSTSCLKSVSTSEESLQIKRVKDKKVDNLDVHFSPGKRKTRTSPCKDKTTGDASDSESNPDTYKSTEKPRQKKSSLSRWISREKSPLRKKDRTESDSETEMDKSPRESRRKRDKSPTYVKKNKSPKGSQSKLEKSPSHSSKLLGMVKGFFSKRDEETKLLCATDDSGETEDPPKNKNKDKPGYNQWKGQRVPEGFHLVNDVNFSDTTCDSTSTKFSMASISTDSPTSDTANPTRTNIPDQAPTNPLQETKTSNLESDDDGKMEEN